MDAYRGRFSRGYLPHFDSATTQFLTWRLADSLPGDVLDTWSAELSGVGRDERRRELTLRIERYCDAGHGACSLSGTRSAREMQEQLFAHHLELYVLRSWVVMPNHVHALLTPIPPSNLSRIMKSLKGASSKSINGLLGRTGRLWQPDYFDKIIRSDEQFAGTVRYIEWNPVKAGLCQDPKLWPWSSANEDAWHRLETVSQGKTTPG